MKKLFFIMLVVLISVSLFAEKKVEKLPLLNDANPASVIPAITDDIGDIIFDIDVETIISDNQLLGVEYDGTHMWVTGGGNAADPNYLYKIDPVAGTLIATYEQPASSTGWGIRDLAWVESEGLIYGGNESNFYSFNPATEVWTTVFTGSIGSCTRALAYDGNHFWTKSFSDPLYEFDVNGTIINTYPNDNSTYGMAYDSFADCLWLFASPTTFVQFGLDGVPTGTSYAVTLPNAGIIGGAFYYEGGLVPGKTILGCLGQGTPDAVYGMELRDAAPIDSPGAPTNVVVTPDAGGALEAVIDWVCPDVTVGGATLTELDEMNVYRNNELIYTDTSPTIGGAGTYSDVVVPASGNHAYKVVGSNTAGEGIPVVVSTWVGEDVPNAVTDLVLTDVSTDDLIAQLNWVNPTTGLHGGYFAGVTGYDIVRSDGEEFDVTGSLTTWQDDTIVNPGVYFYTVTPYNGSGSGPSTSSPQVGIGVSIVQVGNEETGDYEIPINLWYMDSMVEVIYLQEWLGSDMLINTVSFHANTSSAMTDPANLEIWMGETAETDLSAGWIDGTNMIQVFGGTLDVPPGDSWIDIPLDTSFEYTYSGNLLMMIIRDDNEYYSTSDLWWCTESNTPYRTRYDYTDNSTSSEFNAITGPWDGTYEKSIYPDVRFYWSPLEHGDVEGVITDSATSDPVAGVEVFVGNWGPATTNALGEYLLEDIVIGVQEVTATKDGYYDFVGSVEVLTNQMVTYDFSMDANLFGALDGTVTDADSGDPLVGAEINAISLGGYEYNAITDGAGYYSIVDVVAETYDISCSLQNYPTEIVEDVVIADGALVTLDFALEGYAYWNDFETNDGGLISDNATGWQWGALTSGPMTGYSGTNGWGTVIGGDYPTNSNFTLDTPVPFFIESSLAMLEFWHWYEIENSWDGGNVKISADGGNSWTVITPLTGYPGTANTSNPLNGEPIFCGYDQGFWELVQFDLSGYVGQSIIFRWHFGSDSSVQYPGWYIDDVSISHAGVPDPGWLEGTVVEFGTGTPIEGATVSVIGSGLSAVTGADGSYDIQSIWPGDYDISCVAPLYLDSAEMGFAIGEGANTLDFSMLWSELSVDVTELTSYLPPDDIEVQTFIITNNGPGDLEYNITFDFPADVRMRRVPNTQKLQNSRTSSNRSTQLVTKKTNKESVVNDLTGLAPHQVFNSSNVQQYEPNTNRDPDYQSYAYCAYDPSSTYPEGPVTFILNNPAGLTSLGASVTDFIASATWVGDTWIGCEYGTGNFYIMGTDGTMTLIGGNGTVCNGLAYDDNSETLYGATYGTGSDLYIIDPTTGNGTLVGNINAGIIIGMACDNEGNLYGVDLGDDNLYAIDPATGAGTVIGPLGINLNYAQDAEYDKDGETLYLSAYTASGELYTCDTATGSTTYIGAFTGGMEVTGFAIPYSRESWVSITANASVTVPGNGGTVEVEVTFDAAELLIGDERTADLVIHNNSNYTTTRGDDYIIPVTLIISGNIPPINLDVDEETALFTWDTPPGSDRSDSRNDRKGKISLNNNENSRDLLGYNVFLGEDQVGTTTENEWQYDITELVIGDSYVAGVSAVYDDGESEIQEFPFTYLGPGDAGNIIPLITELRGNYPNPFNPTTTISFSTIEAGYVSINIYNMRGQLVKTLVNGVLENDYHEIVWDGRDNSGKNTSSGVYFYKMRAQNYNSTKKMILMK